MLVLCSLDTLTQQLLEPLLIASRRENFRAIQRLWHDWQQGENRFCQEGELLLGGFWEETLVAVGGLNLDPFVPVTAPKTGRIRRLYILPEYRRRGIASTLVTALLEHARPSFSRVHVRTNRDDAAAFYEALGFFSSSETSDFTHFWCSERGLQ